MIILFFFPLFPPCSVSKCDGLTNGEWRGYDRKQHGTIAHDSAPVDVDVMRRAGKVQLGERYGHDDTRRRRKEEEEKAERERKKKKRDLSQRFKCLTRLSLRKLAPSMHSSIQERERERERETCRHRL